MRIEKLNENKIRIFLSTDDLKAKNIDIHTLMSNSIESQDLFIDMLSLAESQVGFQTKNYKLLIEALASSDGNFVFTITRVQPENNIHSLSKPRARRLSIATNKQLSIYRFNNFEDYCEFCNYLNASFFAKLLNRLKNSTLVLFNNNYYLILRNLKLSLNDLKKFSYMITEFAKRVKDEELLESKLNERGKVIIKKDAINTCLVYFK